MYLRLLALVLAYVEFLLVAVVEAEVDLVDVVVLVAVVKV
tara:strand:- start:1001 stop:1120 length:120 start_codon:yes stop_codon:yes gene_type:complete